MIHHFQNKSLIKRRSIVSSNFQLFNHSSHLQHFDFKIVEKLAYKHCKVQSQLLMSCFKTQYFKGNVKWNIIKI
jgi:hypothetical protein